MKAIRRLGLVAALVSVGSLGWAMPASALPSVDLTNTVTGAEQVGSCTSGNQTYQVTATITVHNTSEENAVFETTDFDVKYNLGGGGQQAQPNVTVISDGGFIPGQSVAAGATESYNVVVQVTLPCNITSANLTAKLTLVGRPNKEFSDNDEFVSSGTVIPAAGIGGLALAALLGGGLLLLQLRGQRSAA
jgi:hypothetical protein